MSRSRWAVVLCILAVSWLSQAPAGASDEYSYQDNVTEFMASGMRNLEAGKLADAELDFENVMTVSPGHVPGRKRLLDVYLLQGKGALARRTLDALVAQGALADADKAEFERRLAAVPSAPPPPTAPPRPTATPAAAAATGSGGTAPTGKPVAASSATGSSGSSGDGGRLTAEEKFDEAKRLRRSGRTADAIRLFVAAIQENPGLLGRDDEGLLEISRRHYTLKAKEEPDDANVQFVLAYFHEVFSEFTEAQGAYRRVSELAGADSRLGRVARSKVESLQVAIANKKLQDEEATRIRAGEERAARLADLAAGRHATVAGAENFLARGKELYASWNSSKKADELEEARAWLEGAVTLDGELGEARYSLALVCIEQAADGVAGARDAARTNLEKAVTCVMDEAQKASAQALLDSLSSASSLSSAGSSGSTTDTTGSIDDDQGPSAGDGIDEGSLDGSPTTTEPRYKPRNQSGW